MMAHSLAEDGDLTYTRQDLARVWHEFPAGPTGVFLKKGREVRRAVRTGGFRSSTCATSPTRDAARLYYGKSYMYPLVAAPFVWLLGHQRVRAVLHALLLAALVFAAYLFLAARSPSTVAMLLGAGYFLATVTPGYVVWMTPELFNLATVTLAYFCWLYKEVAPQVLPRGLRWLRTHWSDMAAVVLLAMASFSKPPNAALIGPMVLLGWSRRRWSWGLLLGVGFTLLVAGLFIGNLAITGDLNFQGGERRTYYIGFPFMDPTMGFEVGMGRSTNEVLTDIVFDPGCVLVAPGMEHRLLLHRASLGDAAVFLPGSASRWLLFLWPSDSAAWAGNGSCLPRWWARRCCNCVWLPYTYYGGPGVLGSRYYMNIYGLQLFLLPALARWRGPGAVVRGRPVHRRRSR